MHLIRLIVKLLKSLCIWHPYQKIQRRIVAVRNDAENRLFPFAQLAKLHIVGGGDALDFR